MSMSPSAPPVDGGPGGCLSAGSHPERKADDVILGVRNVSKRFGSTVALTDVNLDVRRGEIVGLLGENGAGKSTLICVLSGVLQPDSGQISVEDRLCRFNDAHAAQVAGIFAVYQHLALAPHLDVAENLFLGRTGSLAKFVKRRALHDRAADVLAELGWPIDVYRQVGSLPTSDQQLVEIARGIASNARVLLLDEPTSSLNTGEVEVLISRVQVLARNGIATIFVSHQLDEVFDLVDSFAVLRDGRVALRCEKAETDRNSVVSAMLGATSSRATIDSAERSARDGQQTDAIFELRGLTRPGAFEDVSLAVAPGEIVSLTGLRGCGAVEVATSVFDQAKCSGHVTCLGRPGPLKMSELIRLGVGYVASDRAQSLFPDLSVRENIDLTARVAGLSMHRRPEDVMDLLAIRAHDLRSPVRELSGGNQQKVVIGRWLVTAIRALILVEPTRGVDIGVRADIHRLIRELAESGVGILMASLDAEEMEAVCSRVLVMHDGRVRAELDSDITVKTVRETVAAVASTRAGNL